MLLVWRGEFDTSLSFLAVTIGRAWLVRTTTAAVNIVFLIITVTDWWSCCCWCCVALDNSGSIRLTNRFPWSYQQTTTYSVFTRSNAWRSASAVLRPIALCLSLRPKHVLDWNGWMDWAHFWHRGYPRFTLHCVWRENGYLQKYGFSPNSRPRKISKLHISRHKCCQLEQMLRVIN